MWRMLLHRSVGSLAILAPLLKDLAAATTSILSDHAGSWMLDIYIIHTFYILNCWKFTGLVQKLMTSYNLTLRGGALTWPQLNVQVGSSVSTCFNMFQHVSTCFNISSGPSGYWIGMIRMIRMNHWTTWRSSVGKTLGPNLCCDVLGLQVKTSIICLQRHAQHTPQCCRGCGYFH